MPKYIFTVLTNPAEGRDAEFNDWYDKVHIPDVLKVPGFVAAQRFKLAKDDSARGAKHQYLAIYEIETDDLAAVKAALQEASRTKMKMSTASDSNAKMRYYAPIGPRVTRKG